MPDLNRYLDIRSAGGGRITADGETLVFITNITGIPQAWSMPVGGGWPHQVTFADRRVGSVDPSPADSSVVLFSRDDGGNERMQIHAIDPAGFGERDLIVDPDVIHRFGAFESGGRWFVFCDNSRNGVDFDLYRGDLDGGRHLIAELDGWNSISDLSPDGTAVLMGHFESNIDGRVWLIDLETGGVDDLTPHDGSQMNYGACFDDDGSVYIVSDRDGEFRRAYKVSDGLWRPFGPDDADIDALTVDGGVGVIGWNAGGRTSLAWFDPGTLDITGEIDLPVGVAGGVEIAPDGATVVFGFSGPAHPSDVWHVGVGETTPARLTESSAAGVDRASFVVPAVETVASFDGLEIPVWVYRPAGIADPPVVVSVHGGPEAQERVGFNPLYQYLLAAGYAVVAPNVRGSSGYGATYMSLDDVRLRMDSVRDLEAIGRWVIDANGLDGSRMALFGGSYGGFMVLAGLATSPDLWAAGVDIVGIANFVTFLENTGDYRRALREAEYGSLADDREFLESISPTSMVDSITAPLLVIHGANDPRVPLGEATQIADRLAELGRTVDLMVFDDEGHGIVKLPNRRKAYGRVAEFLSEVLGDRSSVLGSQSSSPTDD